MQRRGRWEREEEEEEVEGRGRWERGGGSGGEWEEGKKRGRREKWRGADGGERTVEEWKGGEGKGGWEGGTHGGGAVYNRCNIKAFPAAARSHVQPRSLRSLAGRSCWARGC